MRPTETIVTWLLLFFLRTSRALNCSSAPEVGRRIICLQIRKWDEDVRSIPPKNFAVKSLKKEQETIFDCMTLDCICKYTNGVCPGKSVRKDYRLMTDDERSKFHAAFWALKKNGDYPVFSRIHEQFLTSPGAHSGPAFFPWHREYMKRVEIALRRVDPSLPGLPFWDSTLDRGLPNPLDSVLFSDELMGQYDPADGSVRTGAFANWTIADGSRVVTRMLGDMSSLMSEDDLFYVYALQNVTDFLAFTAPLDNCTLPASWDAPEYVHGKPHVWTGGDMLLTRTSTFDPLFFLHHSYCDLMWENWRITHQDRTAREIEYPPSDPDCSTSAHYFDTEMVPFNKRNIDGLSNQYFDNLVSYGPTATCSEKNIDCGSKFLFCDISHGPAHCVSKARVGGKCTGFKNGEDACYGGKCVDGVCKPSDGATATSTASTTTTTTTIKPTPITSPTTTTTTTTTTTAKPTTTTTTAKSTTTTKATTTTTSTTRTTTTVPATTTTPTTTTPTTTTTTTKVTSPTTSPTTGTTTGYPPTPTTTYPSSTTTTSTNSTDSDNCFNDHFCCTWWATTGQCSVYPKYMLNKCKASCSICKPTFDLKIECSDRSSSCPQLVGLMGCESEWMSENCRKFCGMCGATREDQCTVGFTWDLTPPKPENLCLNTHFCCIGWASVGYCSNLEYFDFMTMYCGPSCGRCGQKTPHPSWSNTNGCIDFLPNCSQLALQGNCKSNEVYMKENCKQTCGFCDVLDFKTRMAECGLNRGMTFTNLVMGGDLAM